MQPTKVRNETPCYLELTGAEGRSFILSPLQEHKVKPGELDGFDLSVTERAGLINASTEPPSETLEKVTGVGCMFAFGLGVVCSIVAGIKQPPFFSAIWREFVWGAGVILYLVIVGIAALTMANLWRLFARSLAQAMSLVFILAIGLGLPALTIYHFGEGKTLLAHPSSELFARLLQVGFIGTASLLPVLLFFLFDRYQLSTMRNRLYRDLFRLDHGLQKRADIDVKYGPQIGEAYGPDDQTSGRLARGTRSPVLVCAFVMTMGWLAAFKPIGPVDEALMRRPLSPEHTALTFGFLGAYFFGLQLISRRYARGDLKPKAYGYVTTRIIIVAVLSWALELFYTKSDSNMILIAAFLTGIVPEEFFTFIKELLRGRGPTKLVPESEKHPLTRLEGIDLYDRARLEQEGIVNVESLAHYDLIQLVIETQIPVPRLVDWMDQAILYLHVVEEPKADKKPTTGQRLREYGIRTATDMLACWDAAAERGEVAEFKRLLGSDGKIHRLELIRDALLDDEWLKRILDWRKDPDPRTIRINVADTFEAKLSWAVHLEDTGHLKEAIQKLEEALTIRDDATAHLSLARLYGDPSAGSDRDVSRSREHATRAFELGSNDLALVTQLAEIFQTNGDLDEAIVVIDHAIALIGNPQQDDGKKKALKRLKEKKEALQKAKQTPAPAPVPDASG